MAAIQWFPGHMHKARKEIAKILPEVDVIIEVLDARLPLYSRNPLVEGFVKKKPFIMILNKADLADASVTERWKTYLEDNFDCLALVVDQDKKSITDRIHKAARQLVPNRGGDVMKPIRGVIMGIPNVGKSTIVNALLGRNVAKVGNEPAVTKAQARYKLKEGMHLIDTPGMLWPKIWFELQSYSLAASGAIKDTAMEYEDVGFFLAEFLGQHYASLLSNRYKIETLPEGAEDIINVIGRKSGCLVKGGHIDFYKASKRLVSDLRDGKLGRISFEVPPAYSKLELPTENE